MTMSLIKFTKLTKFIKKKGTVIPARLVSSASGGASGEGNDGGSDDKGDDESNDLTDFQLSLCCPSDDNPSAPTMYDCRKYGHNLPCDSVAPCFETLPYIPTGIFRCTYGEVLGRGANKCSCYQNPEYFSYHHMTFYDMHLILRPCRQPAPKTGRKL